jgi:hypothetical protein
LERDRIAGFDAEFVEKRFGIGDAVAPLFGFGAKIEDVKGVFGADAQLPFPSFHFLDGDQRNLQAQVAAEKDLVGFEQSFATMRFPIRENGASEFLSHERCLQRGIWAAKTNISY